MSKTNEARTLRLKVAYELGKNEHQSCLLLGLCPDTYIPPPRWPSYLMTEWCRGWREFGDSLKRKSDYFLCDWYEGTKRVGTRIMRNPATVGLPYELIACFPRGQTRLARKVLRGLENNGKTKTRS